MNIYQMQNNQATIRPAAGFNPNGDSEALKKAMKGLGCDKNAVIKILCRRSNAQRQQIRLAFKTMYGQDLIKELISELHGHLEDTIVALMYPPEEFDALELRKAMAGVGTTEATLIEIMCTRTNAQIQAIKAAYGRIHSRDLERDLQSETSGHFKRLLTSMSVGARDESNYVNSEKAVKDAKLLYQAGEKRWGTDESMFNAILCSQSPAQLRAVFEEYHKLTGHDMETAINGEFSGDIRDGLLALVKVMKNRPTYFAERLYLSMKGLGTDDDTLIRCIVSRCELDLAAIKQAFQQMYGKTLEDFITDDTSRGYKAALLTLVQGN